MNVLHAGGIVTLYAVLIFERDKGWNLSWSADLYSTSIEADAERSKADEAGYAARVFLVVPLENT